MSLFMTRAEQEAMAAHETKLANTRGKDLPGRPENIVTRSRAQSRMQSDAAIVEAALVAEPGLSRKHLAEATGLSYERIARCVNSIKAKLGIPIRVESGFRTPRIGLRASKDDGTHP